MTSDVNQTGNTVGRDQAGRDIHNTTVNVAVAPETAMSRLARLYEEERASGAISDAIIAELEHWVKMALHDPMSDLDSKLTDANRQDELREARLLKEWIAMQISRFTFSPAAQQIFAFALASVHTRFRQMVWPSILEGKPRTVIDSLVLKEVIDPVSAQLDPNPLGLDPHAVRGLIYYLAGNCHLRWNA